MTIKFFKKINLSLKKVVNSNVLNTSIKLFVMKFEESQNGKYCLSKI